MLRRHTVNAPHRARLGTRESPKTSTSVAMWLPILVFDTSFLLSKSWMRKADVISKQKDPVKEHQYVRIEGGVEQDQKTHSKRENQIFSIGN